METQPRVAFVALLCTALANACNKKEQPIAQQTSSSAPANAASSAEKAAPPVDADSLTLQYQLGDVPVPPDNLQTNEKAELGHLLFFEKRLSADGKRSCYGCHRNEDGNGGHEPVAIGVGNKPLTRHSPTIWNVGYAKKLNWDGAAATLEEQAKLMLSGPYLGIPSDKLEAKVKELSKIPGYRKAFDAAFPGKGATSEAVAMALAAYERTLVCNDTAYDRYAKGEKTALSAEQKRGLLTFTNKAGCPTCHTPPFFSIAFLSPDGAYFNAGVGTQGKKEEEVDVGRMAVSKAPADWAAFKPPSLRNVSKSAPYFHDGSAKALPDAVRFMASGGAKNKNLTPLLSDKQLSDTEIDELVAFLGSLECGKKLEEPALPK
ncbi:MAG TPA: cytochrome c peroxidase [Polyangiaceae bacterium]|nr:cytochrome c peroxidase [Polyangiaceae bacterium]